MSTIMLDEQIIPYQADLERIRRLMNAQLSCWPVQDEQDFPVCVLIEMIAILDDSIDVLSHQSVVISRSQPTTDG